MNKKIFVVMSASKHLPMHLIEVGKTPLNIQRKKRLVNAGRLTWFSCYLIKS